MGSDFGRRTWDREEHAELAKQGQKPYEESLRSSLTDDQLQLLKTQYTDHRALMESSLKGLNRKVLATGVSSFKKGKQFGFYCELCNLTFKDNLQYIDHLNHKSHQIRFEAIFDEPLVIDSRDNDYITAQELQEEYDTLVKQFVRQHKTKVENTGRPKKKQAPKTSSQSRSSEVAKAMGFASFGGSKK